MNFDPNEIDSLKLDLEEMFSEPEVSRIEQEFAQASERDQAKTLDALSLIGTKFRDMESRLAGVTYALDRNETARRELADAMKAKHG